MSYGTNAPFGLQPRYMLTGATWNNQTSDYLIAPSYGTSLFTGDPVTWSTSDNGTIAIGTAGNPIMGVFMGCEYLLNNTYVYSPYWPAGTTPDNGSLATAFVVDDPNVLFDIQVANGGGLVQGDMGQNANFSIVGNTGSTITGQSAYYLDFATIMTTATLNLKLIRFTPNPINLQATTFNNALVLINNHQYKGGTGTLGV